MKSVCPQLRRYVRKNVRTNVRKKWSTGVEEIRCMTFDSEPSPFQFYCSVLLWQFDVRVRRSSFYLRICYFTFRTLNELCSYFKEKVHEASFVNFVFVSVQRHLEELKCCSQAFGLASGGLLPCLLALYSNMFDRWYPDMFWHV